MSIDTQFVGGKVQLTFTFDAKEDGADIEFARRVKSSALRVIGELSPQADEGLLHLDAANERVRMRNAMQALVNAFESVEAASTAHRCTSIAVKLANGGNA